LEACSRTFGRMHSLARVPVLAIAALILCPLGAGAADLPEPSGARFILKPGTALRVPAGRSALITGRLNPCYLGVTGGDGKVDFVLESKDEARGVVLLGGEIVTNLGGTSVKGGTFPRVTCLLSVLLYPSGPAMEPVPAPK
jgi:hypothetical protein